MKNFWVTDATESGEVVFNEIISAPTDQEAKVAALYRAKNIVGYSGMMTFECTLDDTPAPVKPASMVCRDTGCAQYIITGRQYMGRFNDDGDFVTLDGRHIARKQDNLNHAQFKA